MGSLLILGAPEVDPGHLAGFLRSSFGERRGGFLASYGDWWYRDGDRQRVVLDGDQIVAYSASIPTSCLVAGEEVPAAWWLDLIVAPEQRGRGIQSLIDNELRDGPDRLLFGFPNKIAAQIHAKHGWGISERSRVYLLPLIATELQPLQGLSPGKKAGFMSAGAKAASPLTSLLARRAARFRPRDARRVEMSQAEADRWSKTFARFASPELVTTFRNADHLKRRYLSGPYRDEISFYTAGRTDEPSHCLILRIRRAVTVSARVLDVFGDLSDRAGLRDVIGLAVREATEAGAAQVTAMASSRRLSSMLLARNFLLSRRMRFCWYSKDPGLTALVAQGDMHWTLGDSDNDGPE